MSYIISFYGDDEEPMKITDKEYQLLLPCLNRNKFVQVKGAMKAVSLIKSINPVKKEPLGLKTPEVNSIAPEKVREIAQRVREKWKNYN